ncbi:hypothetical protein B0H11DRAFT_2141420 [Mycena galericulata]|nr:hypothetical protein B0H11DRAFT_2141420 [Mycena galericulata]
MPIPFYCPTFICLEPDSMSSSDIQTEVDLNGMYYLNAITFTLLFYDYFLTFEWEISRYWGSEITWPTVLFFLNRYGSLLGNIPVVIQFFWITPSTPQKSASYHQYFLIGTQAVVAALLILRTYALYERDNRVLAFMLVICGGAGGVCIWRSVVDDTSDVLINGDLGLDIGCIYAITGPQSVGLIIAWMALVLFDCMIFFLTLYRALNHRSTGARLLTVFVMVISNTSNILTFADYTRGVATTFANTISTIMISRLMLNLRDPVLSNSGFRNIQLNFSMLEFSTHPTLTGVVARSRNINTSV